MSEKFPPSFRLKKSEEYRNVLSSGRFFVNRYMVFYYKENELFHSRLGVITSKKKLGLAVWRNRIKRLTRETFRKLKNELLPFDVVLLVSKTAAQASNEELIYCLKKTFSKIRP